MRDKNKNQLPIMKFEVETSEKEHHATQSRRSVLPIVINHSTSAVDLVELVSELGLNHELEEMIRGSDRREIAVTNARSTSELDLFMDIPDPADEEECS